MLTGISLPKGVISRGVKQEKLTHINNIKSETFKRTILQKNIFFSKMAACFETPCVNKWPTKMYKKTPAVRS